MEEKRYIRYTYTHPYDDAYEIVDRNTDGAMKPDEVCNLLNQQDKQIKELEEQTYPAYKREHKRRAYLENIEVPRLEKENQQLKQKLEDYKDICHKHYIDCSANLDRVLLGMEQQLHDLPKKIVGDIENELLPEFSGSKDYEHKYYIITKRILDTILKKYGG